MNESKCNAYCSQCTLAHNSINGRWCTRLRRYVQHLTTPPCGLAANRPSIKERIAAARRAAAATAYKKAI